MLYGARPFPVYNLTGMPMFGLSIKHNYTVMYFIVIVACRPRNFIQTTR